MDHSIVIAGFDYNVSYDFKITAHGNHGVAPSLSYPGDPPEPPEFEIEVIDLRVDTQEGLGPSLELPAWLKSQLETYLSENGDVFQAVCEADDNSDYGDDS